jgi:DNA primase
MASEKRIIEASGRSVEISSPDKIYFPDIEATKYDLAS